MQRAGQGFVDRPSARRVRYVVPVAAVALMAAGAGSADASTFGGRIQNGRGYGERVSITTPSASQRQDRNEILLHRAVVQDGFGSNVGLVQAGVYRTGANARLDSCSLAAGVYRQFSERHAKNSGVRGFKCRLYNTLRPGQTVTYSVYRRTASQTWSVRLGSRVGGTYKLGFNTAIPQIGGELNKVGDRGYRSSTSARYGSNASWTTFARPNLTSGRQVQRSDPQSFATPTDSRWRVPLAPTPLTISRIR